MQLHWGIPAEHALTKNRYWRVNYVDTPVKNKLNTGEEVWNTHQTTSEKTVQRLPKKTPGGVVFRAQLEVNCGGSRYFFAHVMSSVLFWEVCFYATAPEICCSSWVRCTWSTSDISNNGWGSHLGICWMAHMYQSKDRSVLGRFIDSRSIFVYKSEGTNLLPTLGDPGPSA